MCNSMLNVGKPDKNGSLWPQEASSPVDVEEHKGTQRKKMEGKPKCPDYNVK